MNKCYGCGNKIVTLVYWFMNHMGQKMVSHNLITVCIKPGCWAYINIPILSTGLKKQGRGVDVVTDAIPDKDGIPRLKPTRARVDRA